MTRGSIALTLLTLGGCFGWARPALASVELCVEAKTEVADNEGFRRLVLSEVARHPSHHAAEANCQSRLRVELFRTNGARYLTVQLDGEVPDRSTIQSDAEVASRLTTSISQVLGNDPMHLSEDPAKWSALERASRSVLVRGLNTYRIELFEILARTDHNIASAPGIGLGFSRGADQWQIGARLHLAGNPFAISGTDRALRLSTGMDLSVSWEASRRARTSGYLSAGAGVTLVRFEGFVDPNEPRSLTDVTSWLPTLNLRAGIRFLRVFDFDADVFVQSRLPVLPTKQIDNDLWGTRGPWTPMMEIGIGVGF